MKKVAFFCLLFLVALAAASAAQSRETFTLAASGCRMLRIDCGAGSLKVVGEGNSDKIEVNAVLDVRGLAENELPDFKKEHVELKLEQTGDHAVLIAKIESGFSLENLFGGHDARIDLEVRLPRRLSLAVDDGSGDIEIREIDGGLDLEDGSGSIRVTNVQGPVKIDDGSGDMQLAGLKGGVKIIDGSGDIELKDAGGDVSVEDGSGEIRLYHVLGSVRIDDGSGDIVIDGVEKDVTIEEAGSGGLEIHNVKGSVRK
jgi:DUF4097 and DUF4098 domain-containing protein YvlB